MSQDISTDPVKYAESVLSWCGQDIDRSIAAVNLIRPSRGRMDQFFKLAVVRELEKLRV